MHDEYYQMYLDELEGIAPCSPGEEAELLARVCKGDDAAKKRLTEGFLGYIAEIAKEYADRGLPMGDLVQEANMALIIAVDAWQEGDFRTQLKAQVEAALEAALGEQEQALRVEEEVAARVNVLKDISRQMAEELGREASVEELAEKMKMTVDEIKAIMKLTLDAISVPAEVEE